MRSQWLIIDFGTEPDLPLRRSDRVLMNVPRVPHLHWLATAILLVSSGCITPCLTGACNSSQPLYVSPMTRFGSVEKKWPDACEPTEFCKPLPYFTFGKYWPKLDEWRTTRTALKCARRNLFKQMWETKSWINAHYREGFAQAFIDVANGGNGELPAVPPPRYWNAHFRSAKGEWRVERWFDGYRAGSAIALVQMQPLRRITASYDWSIEKPKPPFVSSPMGLNYPSGVPAGGQYMQTGGFGMPGPQGFPGQSFGLRGFPTQPAPFNGFPGPSMATGYGNTPVPPGQPGFGYGPPGPQGPPPGGFGSGVVDPGFAPGAANPAGPPARPFHANPPRGAVQPPQQPGTGAPANPQSSAIPPGGGGLVPGYGAGSANQVGRTPADGPASPAPRQMTPGFSTDTNLPAGIPRDEPVWRTRPPRNTR